jgi:hypothetical protein
MKIIGNGAFVVRLVSSSRNKGYFIKKHNHPFILRCPGLALYSPNVLIIKSVDQLADDDVPVEEAGARRAAFVGHQD